MKTILLATLLGLTSQFAFAQSDDFSDLKPQNSIKNIERSYGTFEVKEGQAQIIQGHASSGEKALRIHGGKSEIILNFKSPCAKPSFFCFRAQRWTSAKPFKFTIEAKDANGKYKQVFNGDKTPMKYGPSQQIRLDKGVQGLRILTETGGEFARGNGGVLLDEVSLDEIGPMEIKSTTSTPSSTPILIGSKNNESNIITVEVKGEENPIQLEKVTISLKGTTELKQIKSIEIVENNKTIAQAPVKGETLTLTLKANLKHGKNVFVVRPIINDKINIDGKINIVCTDVVYSNEKKETFASTSASQRVGVNLGPSVGEKCHTYRIPGMAKTPKGTLIAVWDNRYENSVDLQGDIDIGMRRSTDGGKTWEPTRVIMDMGKFDDKSKKENGVTDPCVLVDEKIGTIWVAALWLHGYPGQRAWGASRPGMDYKVTGQFMLVKSEDDGLTWSEPINITEQIKDPSWNLFLQGPGNGICMKDGTLVFPAQFKDAKKSPHSTVITSKDGGKTWKVGTGAKSSTTEAQVVELANGELMLNMRDDRGGSRSVYTSSDLGQTWKEHPTTRKVLNEPVCMASLIRWNPKVKKEGENILLFSNPNTTGGRHNMTIKASLDDGQTWPEEYHLLYDARGCYGYSCLTQIDDETVGVVYEGSGTMHFLRIPIKEIIKK